MWSAKKRLLFAWYPTSRNLGFRLVCANESSPMTLNSTANLTIAENQPVGTVVSEFNATDPDGDAITYHFVDGDNNNLLFMLDSNGTLKTATIFDYESNASIYSITVQAKDELNATTQGNFTVTLMMCMRIPMGMDFGIPWKPQRVVI